MHVTDYTNASRTLLFDIHRSDAGTTSCSAHARRAARSAARGRRRRAECVGTTDADGVLGAEVPIAGIAGDQQAALFGQACFRPGMAKNTYGTGCFLLMNTGDERGRLEERAADDDRLRGRRRAGVRARGLGVHRRRGGAVAARRPRAPQDGEGDGALRAQGRLDAGVYLVPAFVGLGAPYWDADGARRAGRADARRRRERTSCAPRSSRSPTRRATSSRRWRPSAGRALAELRVDGGASANDFLMQFQADVLGATVDRPKVIETTALGAALLAGRGIGLWSDAAKLERVRQRDRVFKPRMKPEEREELYAGWRRAVAGVRAMAS